MKQRRCFIYVIARKLDDQWCSPSKVGITHSLGSRLSTIQTSCPFRAGIFWRCVAPDAAFARHFEALVHRELSRAHLVGEWFEVSPEDAMRTVAKVLVECLRDGGAPDSHVSGYLNKMGILDADVSALRSAGIVP